MSTTRLQWLAPRQRNLCAGFPVLQKFAAYHLYRIDFLSFFCEKKQPGAGQPEKPESK